MSRRSTNTDGLRPISKRAEWKLLYLKFPLNGNGMRPGLSLEQLNRRTPTEELPKEELAEADVVGRRK
jgi:hypothetical protein